MNEGRKCFYEVNPLSLERIIYRSESAMNMAGTRMLIHFNDIVSKARLYNSAHGICGFLMFDQRWFHQILEGEPKKVDVLFSRIETDKRHNNVKILKREVINNRTFDNWSMGSFLSEAAIHPLQMKYGLTSNTCIEPDTFLAFAHEFAAKHMFAA
jgi:Sensors of blue-light using FAD